MRNMQASKTTYTFDAFDQPGMKAAHAAANANTRKHRTRQHQRTNSEDADPTDGAGSLSYSAASSINSAGESTDSSFADIMKVLDMQDPHERKDRSMTAAEYHMHLQQQAAYNPAYHAHTGKHRSSQASVTSSLQYSTDGESNFLAGTDLVSNFTGQPSDSEANDGGMYSNEAEAFDNLFAPAEHEDSLKKRKKERRHRNKEASQNRHQYQTSQSMSTNNTSNQSDSTRRTVPHKNESPPPRVPRNRSRRTSVEDDICYAEWWMSCFPDAFKEMMPTR